MSKGKRIAGFGTIAILAAASRAVACSSDPSAPLCLCPHGELWGGLTLSAPPGAKAASTVAGGSEALSSQYQLMSFRPSGSPLPPATQNVHVFNFDFSINPDGQMVMDAVINLGDVVHWTWDSGHHSVTSVAGSVESYDSGNLLAPSAVFDHTFTHVGVFTYYCDIHGFDNGDGTADGMFGTITVLAPSATWANDADGNWDDAGSWTGGVPDSADAHATLGGAIQQPRTVTLATARTVGILTFDNANRYTITGAGSLTIDVGSGSGTVEVLAGSHTVDVPVTLAKNTIFTVTPSTSTLTMNQAVTAAGGVTMTKDGAGTLELRNARAAALGISNGAVRMIPDGTAAGASTVATLTVNAGARLDLTDNDLIATATAKSFFEQQIFAARNGGAWDQPGIMSSTAKSQPARATTLGTLTGLEFHTANGAGALFDGFSVADTDVLVKYTYYGDANFNGKVDGGDYSHIDSTFNQEHTAGNIGGWFNGDFNYDGKVDGADYGLIDSAFNSQTGTLARALSYLDGTNTDRSDMVGPGLAMIVEHLDQFGEPYRFSILSNIPEPALGGVTLAIGFTSLLSSRRRKKSPGLRPGLGRFSLFVCA